MSVADTRYGRRGGGWAPARAGRLLAELADLRVRHQAAGTWPQPVNEAPDHRCHPSTIARHRAHTRHCGGRHDPGEDCPAVADPDDLHELWAGRARMAAARRAAGVPLNDLDRQALAQEAGR